MSKEREKLIRKLYSIINKPYHYTQGNIETIDKIEDTLTPEEFRGYVKKETDTGTIYKSICPDKSITNNDFVNNSYWVRYIEGDRRFE